MDILPVANLAEVIDEAFKLTVAPMAARIPVAATGLVDTKVCAVDDVWSGLKLVIRRELRKKTVTSDE